MSKTFTPIHSDKPEERFVVEKILMAQPSEDDLVYSSSYVKEYNDHVNSLTKYPFPSLTRDMPDELIEGVHFKLEHWCNNPGTLKGVHTKIIDTTSDSFENAGCKYCYLKAVPISVKTEPTPSVEKKKKVLKSESIPEFDEGLTSMTEEQKARVDASMGLSMEDVLNQAITEEQQRMLLEDTFVIHRHNGIEYRTILERVVLSAMQHWASIKCAEKDREIDELKRDKLYWQLEASAKNKELSTKHKTP